VKRLLVLVVLALSGCATADRTDAARPRDSAPTATPQQSRTIDLQGAVLTLALNGWVQTGEQQSDEGHLIAYRAQDGGPESLTLQALSRYAGTPVSVFYGGLVENILSVCRDADIAPVEKRHLGSSPAVILRFSCETTARARTASGLAPFEAGLYAIVPTSRAMVVVHYSWSGPERPDDFSEITLRPGWQAFLRGLSVCDPAKGQNCSPLSQLSVRQLPAAPPARQTPARQSG